MAGTFLRRIFSNQTVNNMAEQDNIRSPAPILRSKSSAKIPPNPEPACITRHDRNLSNSQDPTKRHRSRSTSTAGRRDRRTSYDSVREARGEDHCADQLSSCTTNKRAADIPQSFRRKSQQLPKNDGAIVTSPPSSIANSTAIDDTQTVSSLSSLEAVPAQRTPAPIESLPTEILESIISLLAAPNANNEYASPYADIVSCLQVSRILYTLGIQILYRDVSIPHSIKFSKFMNIMGEDSDLANLVRRLNFSRYSNIGFGRTRQASSEIMNVTPKTLSRCLDLTSNLTEFLVHEHIDDELSAGVLRQAFSLPKIEALDFCACSSTSFTEAFTTVTTTHLSGFISSSLQRLSLHECTTLQAGVFESLLPLLPNLTHLDVAHTLITDEALLSIPPTARITHLNLGRCTRLTGSGVVKFVTEHPAARDSLVFLNLMAEPSRYRLLSARDLNTLLPQLPPTLRSLNIGGSRINSTHIPTLYSLTRHIEELGLSNTDLASEDLELLFAQAPQTQPCALRYLDLTGISSISQFSLQFAKSPSHTPLASNATYPLEVIELSENVLEGFKKIRKPSRGTPQPEWVVRELGRRGWLVRAKKPAGLPETDTNDDGAREWKMGARWWGARKVSVARMEVGGMYGFYAFKRI